MIIHEVAPACRAVDRLAQARLERLLIGLHERRGRVQFAEQVQVPLGQAHDHLDKGIDTFSLQMIANARKRADAFRIGTAARGVRGQRRRHHVLLQNPQSSKARQEHSPPMLLPRPVTSVR